MASFTDQISQFNPYIAQLPVEAMVKVGMQKQQQYDQGVQKVQAYIDNIAGIDVIKDEHKQYLQSKVNQLGSDLKKVAASDFSNQQLVTSVGGMATQIIKDPTVQSAVYSTQRIRKGQQEMEAARKAGKSNKNNEDKYNSDINEWLNDKNLDSTFRGGYREYRDYNKKFVDLADKLKEETHTVEIPWVRDEKGNTIYFDKTGNASLDPNKGQRQMDLDMLKVTTKGKPAEKILAAFNATLDADDEEQMKIDSWARYRGRGIEAFSGDINKTYELKKNILQKEAVNLAVDLQSAGITDVLKASMQARLTDINTQLTNGSIDKERAATFEALKDPNTLDRYKLEIFKNKHLYNLADSMSNQSYEYAHVANPALQMKNELQKIQMTADQNRITNQQWLSKFQADEAERVYQHGKDAKAEALLDPKVTSGYIPTDKDVPTLSKYDAQIKGTQTSIDNLNLNSAPLLASNDHTVAGKKATLDGLYNNYITNPKEKISNDVRDYVETRRVLEMKKARETTLYNQISKGSQAITKELDNTLSKELGVYSNTGNLIFSAKDLVEVADAYGKAFKTKTGSVAGTTSTSFDAKEFMNQFKGTNKEKIAQAYYKSSIRAELSPTEKVVISKAGDLKSKYSQLAGDVNRKRLDYEKNSLLKYDITRQQQVGTINPANKADEASIFQLLGNKTIDYNTAGAMDTESKSKFNPKTIAEWRTGKGAADLKYTIIKNYDGTANLHILNGTEEQVVPMTTGEVQRFFPSVSKRHPLEDAKSAINQSMAHTTNSAGTRGNPAGAVSAMYSGFDIPQLRNTKYASLVRYDIEGRAANDGSKTDGYQIQMYVNKGGVWKPVILNQAGYKSIDDIALILSNVGTNTINEILK